MNYSFYQHYWWFLISLLGALLVFMMFVQGGQSLVYSLGKNESQLNILLNSLSRKWELTFTTLVTFGGAFFASFPLFYSTSFGGAYWIWMLILLSFVLQAVSYEFISKQGNLLGRSTYKAFLFMNGFLGPVLLGVVVSTFFMGSEFIINKENITGVGMPVISSWQNPLHGLEALADPWNLVLGIAVFFLVRCLACLYFINSINNNDIRKRARYELLINASFFLILFLPYLIKLLLKDGYAENPETGIIQIESLKYWHNLISMPWTIVILSLGVILLLYGIFRTIFQPQFIRGIWFAGAGTVIVILIILIIAGFNNTSYYPSSVDIQSSLTITNSSSSLFTLKVMSIVSLFIPIVIGYIAYTWRKLDKGGIEKDEY